jgi:peptidyl-prolyl cis-trans isomerase B (cyclophilin B)
MDINEYSKALSITSVFADKCRAAAESALESNPEEQQQQSNGGGCLIATAAFGSEMVPQVQFLREIRDNTVLQTESGTSFMTGFNQFYYSFSPVVADYERENPAFKEAVKLTLTPLLTSLTLLQYADIDSESEMLGYGICVILLNIGMYFVAPAVLIMKIRKRT